MREIDFIPEWYKAHQIRKRRYARQYTIIGVIFAMMMIWSFVVGQHVQSVSAEVEGIQAAFAKGKDRVQQALELKSEVDGLKQKAALLDKIKSRTETTAILGELSYLIQDNIILSKLSLSKQPIEAFKNVSPASGAIVQIDSSKSKQNPVIPEAPLREQVVLTGIAAQPADAASLIARLEQAEYFEEVALVFSRPKKIKDRDVTEFEIRCFVADYQIQK